MAKPQQSQTRTTWRIEVTEAGAISSGLYIVPATDKPITAEQALEARLVIDQALSQPSSEAWLEAAHPWVVNDELRIWWRGIGGLRPETRALVARLNKTNAA